MSDDRKPVTIEVMRAYIDVLEKQVQQMALVIKTLEELHDEVGRVENHFHNGFKSDLTDHITVQIGFVSEKIEKALTTVYIIKEYVVKAEGVGKELNDKAYELTNDVKDKIGALKGDIADLSSAIKVDRITNIVGWSVFITSILTMLLRLWGKI